MKQFKPKSQPATFAEKTGKKQRGRPFQPGESGNPGGRPRLAPEVRAQRQSVRTSMLELGPPAIDVLRQELRSSDFELRLRAAKLVIDKTVPDLTEVSGDSSNPFSDLPARFLQEIIKFLEHRAENDINK